MALKKEKLYFASDYQEGAHPRILKRLEETNLVQSPGYGTDDICESARERIRIACGCPEAAVHFLVGGTQTNATVIDALLRAYDRLSQLVEFSFWEKAANGRTIVRLATSWATTEEDVEKLMAVLEIIKRR
jgi:threonine aldolase